MEEPRNKRFLIVEDDGKYASWLQHAVASGWSADTIVLMDWTSFGRVRTAMTVRDYDIVMLAMKFDEGIEEPTTDSFDWIRKLRSQPGFPEMIILAEDGSELAAIRTLRLGAADYLPKRLLTPPRLQRSIKLTLRAIEKEAQRRAERLALAAAAKSEAAKAMRPRPRRQGRLAPTSSAIPIATHTGESLARAAQLAVAAKPVLAPTRDPGRRQPRARCQGRADSRAGIAGPRETRNPGGNVSVVACRKPALRFRRWSRKSSQWRRRITRFRATPSCRRSASPKPRPYTSRFPRISATTSR